MTTINPSWNLASAPISRWVATLADSEVIPLEFNVDNPTRRLFRDPDHSRHAVWKDKQANTIHIGVKVMVEPSEYPPMGQPSDWSYQLAEPIMFGGLAAYAVRARREPWQAVGKPDPMDDDFRAWDAAWKVQQIRSIKAAISNNRTMRHLLGRYFATMEQHFRTAREVVESAFMSYLGRDHIGAIRDGNMLRAGEAPVPSKVRDKCTELLGETLTAELEGLVCEALDMDNPTAEQMRAWGKTWMDKTGTIDRIDEPWIGGHRLGELERAVRDAHGSLSNNLRWEYRFLKKMYPPRRYTRAKHPKLRDEPLGAAMEENNLKMFTEPDHTEMNSNRTLAENDAIIYKQPTPANLATVWRLQQTLKDLHYVTPTLTTEGTQMPTGRPDMRQLVQMTAQIGAGTLPTAEPWNKPVNKAVEQPGLSCAIVVDTSFSTDQFRPQAMETAWALSQAVSAVGGQVSTWSFGNWPFEVINPHTVPADIPYLDTTGAQSSYAPHALARAVERAGFYTNSGVKIAVIITDMGIPQEDKERLVKQVETLENNGVHTLLVLLGDVIPRCVADDSIPHVERARVPWTVSEQLENHILDTYAQRVAA